MPNENIPRHVAIIVDGNRRWARQRMMPASLGHKAGFDRLKEITRYALAERGVEVLSLYVFSTENFARDPKEVGYLMDLFSNNFRTIADEMNERNCKVLFSGRREGLQQRVCDAMDYMMDLTKDNTKGIVNFCLNYGGHAELTDAVRAIAGEVKSGALSKFGGTGRYAFRTVESYVCEDFSSTGTDTIDVRSQHRMCSYVQYLGIYWHNTYTGNRGSTKLHIKAGETKQFDMSDAILTGVLDSCNIPYFKRFPHYGGFGNLMMGMSAEGVDIFVPETMLEEAKNILEGESENEEL